MANLPISGLPSAGSLSGSEVLPIVQSGVTVQVSIAALTASTDLSQYFRKDGTVTATGNFDWNTYGISNLGDSSVVGDISFDPDSKFTSNSSGRKTEFAPVTTSGLYAPYWNNIRTFIVGAGTDASPDQFSIFGQSEGATQIQSYNKSGSNIKYSSLIFNVGADAYMLADISDSTGYANVKGFGIKTNVYTAYIKADNLGNEVTYQLPNKGVGTETFAMISDIVGGGTGTVTSVGITGSDFSISGSPITSSGNIALTLATVNANIGTFNNVTVNAKGLVTAASNVSYLTGNQTITLSGDISGSGSTAITTTIGAGKVTNAMLAGSITDANLATSYIKTDGTRALTGAWYNTLGASFSVLGVGTSSTVPSAVFQSVETSTATLRGIAFDQYNTGTNGSRVNLRKGRGTFGTPTTIVTADIVSNILSWAHDGTNFVNCGSITVTSTGTIATGQTPSTMSFSTMTSAGVLTTALTISAAQLASFSSDVDILGSSARLYINTLVGLDATAGNLRIGLQYATLLMPQTQLTFTSSIILAQTLATGSLTWSTVGGTSVNGGVIATKSGAVTLTSGNASIFSIGTSANDIYAPTSGTGGFTGIDWVGKINQTGGTGVITLIDLHPTITNITGTIYGLRSQLASGSNKWNIYADGTAGNYFGGDVTIQDKNLILGTTTGTKYGTATGQKQGWWNATPVVQPTTAITGASFVVGAGTAVNDASTFDGYTLKQIAAALRQIGLLA